MEYSYLASSISGSSVLITTSSSCAFSSSKAGNQLEMTDSKSSSSSSVVKVISKETIKPSIPTPEHLKTIKISLLDQLSPPLYVPIILFYTAVDDDDDDDDKGIDENLECYQSNILKLSLSETLTRFYPLAGRMKDNMVIDCNDKGVDYFEARVSGNMSEFMKPDAVPQLLPYDVSCNYSGNGKIQLGVQVNKFDCGGIAIGVCISHKTSDASSMSTFINGWATTARTFATESPTFDLFHLYPPSCEQISCDNSFTTQVEGEKVVTKRFVFDASKISNLRAKLGDDDDKKTTRVQAVTGLIWKCAMAKWAHTNSSSSTSSKLSIANLAVNIRRRMDPPLDQLSYGNLLTVATTASMAESASLEELVGQLKVALSKIDVETIKYIQGEGGFTRLQESLLGKVHEMFAKGDEVEVYMFSSWCRFPVYEADFGWGKPSWVSCSSQPYKNTVILMDTRSGDGIEAWVNLVENDMALFQQNQELLEFVSYTDN